MLKLKLQYFGHLIWRTDSFEKKLMLGKIEGGKRRVRRGSDGWMPSPTQWAWISVNSRSWWWTGRPGMLQSIGLQRVGHNCVIELNWTDLIILQLQQPCKMKTIFSTLFIKLAFRKITSFVQDTWLLIGEMDSNWGQLFYTHCIASYKFLTKILDSWSRRKEQFLSCYKSNASLNDHYDTSKVVVCISKGNLGSSPLSFCWNFLVDYCRSQLMAPSHARHKKCNLITLPYLTDQRQFY